MMPKKLGGRRRRFSSDEKEHVRLGLGRKKRAAAGAVDDERHRCDQEVANDEHGGASASAERNENSAAVLERPSSLHGVLESQAVEPEEGAAAAVPTALRRDVAATFDGGDDARPGAYRVLGPDAPSEPSEEGEDAPFGVAVTAAEYVEEGIAPGEEEGGARQGSAGEENDDMTAITGFLVEDSQSVGELTRGERDRIIRRRILSSAPLVQGVTIAAPEKGWRKAPRVNRRTLAVAATVLAVVAVGASLGAFFLSKGDGNNPSPVPPMPSGPGVVSSSPSTSVTPTESPSITPSWSPSISSVPTHCPSGTPSSGPTSDRFQEMLSVLKDVTSRDILEDKSSPQHRALLWLADEDDRMLDPQDTTNVTQRYALATLFFATGGDTSWKNKKNYLSSSSECTWTSITCCKSDLVLGVTCFPDHHTIDQLSLPLNNLTGSIPDEVALLTNLRLINLFRNSLTSTIPDTIGNLHKLRRLLLFDNYLSGPIPSSIGNLSNLYQLVLNDNILTAKIPPSLGHLSQMKVLHLAMNRLHGSIPVSIGNLQAMKTIHLYDNQLSGSIPLSFGNMTSLEKMELFLNHLTGQIPSNIGQLPRIREIALGYNKLTGNVPSSVSNLTTLEVLFVDHNQLAGSLPFAKEMPNLKEIWCHKNNFSGTMPLAIFSSPNLKAVGLNNNSLDGELPTELGQLSKLESFDVGFNFLSGQIPSTITSLRKLQLLSLASNKLHGTLPNEVAALTEMEELYLEDNQFGGTIPETLAGLVKMTNLRLDQNLFNGTLPSSFGQLHSLGQLQIEKNSITGTIDFLCEIESLKNLYADCHGGGQAEVVCKCCNMCCNRNNECFVS